MNKINICRPIVLYHNFVPPTEGVQQWAYCTFGTCDGIDVGHNIEKNDKKLLNAIWHHQRDFCKELCGRYSAQVIYAIKYGSKEQDEIFWNEETANRYPFAFFVRLQCVSNIDKLWENREKLEKGLTIDDRIAVNTYLTYDNSDLFVILKSAAYEDGAKMINTLHQGVNLIMSDGFQDQCILKNSFTIVAIKRDRINQIADNGIAGNVPEIDVRMIEKQNGGIAKVEHVLRKEYPEFLTNENFRRKQILGEDDEVFSFKEIPWSLFLSFYRDNKGIFNNANEEYKRFLSGTTAVIATKPETYEGFCVVEESGREEDEEEALFGRYIIEMNKKLRELGDGDGCELYKELYLIINSLSKFMRPVFADYMFTMMLGTLDTLLDLLRNLSDKYDGVRGTNGKDYYDFLKSFNIYSQNSVRSDRHSMQIMDINTKLYNIPVKLNALYTAYVYRICALLNKQTPEEPEKIRYDFFTVPGAGDQVRVRELYKGVMKERRLIKVEIPERRFYDVKGMMIILSHEVAHYAGRAIRNRDMRYQCMIENIAHIYINYVFHMFLNKKECPYGWLNDDGLRNAIDNKMAVMLLNALNRELNEIFLREQKFAENIGYDLDISLIAKENKDLNYYMAFMKSRLKGALNDIIQYGLKNVFAPVLYVMMGEQREEDFLAQINKISDRFMFEHPEKSTLLSMKTMLDRLVIVYEECFSDLMSVMLLKMSVTDYLDIIIADAAQQGIELEELSGFDIMFRCLLVVSCMLKKSDSNEHVWKPDEVAKAGINDQYAVIVNEIASLYKKFILNGYCSYIEEDYEKNCVNALRDGKVLKCILAYLQACKRKFVKIRACDTDEEKELINTIVKIYTDSKMCENSQDKGIEARMITQLRFIMQYKKDLVKDLESKN